ncbi:rhamnulokinase [Xylanimonas allomyrinae]|nr:rhamnulokinase family protein [Xylanimonas allomyrinae]
MAVTIGADGIFMEELHRFPNGLCDVSGHLVWDYTRLTDGVVEGLRAAAESGPVDGIGIDTWAVDYGLLDEDGNLLGSPVCYRDERTTSAVERFPLSSERLYSVTGIQHQRFNTVYQLAADKAGLAPVSDRLERAARLLLIPDLLAYDLTGVAVTEATNASTTGMFDATTRTWSPEVLAAAGVEESLFGRLVEPGTVIGPVTDRVAAHTGLAVGTPVIAVGSHDTASAVAATPGLTRGGAFISSGTWSLVGIELSAPVLTQAGRAANFTNELGVDDTVRYLRNVMGLWLLTECLRSWAAAGNHLDLQELLDDAARQPVGVAVIAADDEAFLAPGDMPARIAAAVQATGGVVPQTPSQFARCIIDSLAHAYARTIEQASRLTATPIDSVHIVGGGSRNALLCQATADATGLLVHAGPGEATVLGNAIVQARTLGALSGSLDDLRAIVAASFPPTAYTPAAAPTDKGQPARKAV